MGVIDIVLCGSAHAGIFGGIISRTYVGGILKLDCLKTDYYHKADFPAFLYYNLFDEAKIVGVFAGKETADLYDAVTHKFIKEKIIGKTTIKINADTAVILLN